MEIAIEEGMLLRKKYTRPQMKIKKHSHRLENMRDIFETVPGADRALAGKTVLLVDDIATTGATLFGCASALKKGGARKVFSVVIARQEI